MPHWSNVVNWSLSSFILNKIKGICDITASLHLLLLITKSNINNILFFWLTDLTNDLL